MGVGVGEDFVGDFGDEEVESYATRKYHFTLFNQLGHTGNQTLHLIFAENIHIQGILQLVVVFVGTSAGSHDAETILGRTVEFVMFEFQLLYEVDAQVYAVGFEIDEVQTTAVIGGIEFTGEIDQFGEGSADLQSVSQSSVGFNVMR